MNDQLLLEPEYLQRSRHTVQELWTPQAADVVLNFLKKKKGRSRSIISQIYNLNTLGIQEELVASSTSPSSAS